jgi:hypothetical protein
MDGTIDGHRVVVNPDAASISVFFLSDKQIDFAQHKPQTRPTKEMPDFDKRDYIPLWISILSVYPAFHYEKHNP